MLHGKVQDIRSLIPGVVRQVEAQYGALFAIQRGWGKLVGKRLAAHTRPVSLRRGRLVVHADRPGDGFTLSYQQSQLLNQLRVSTDGKVEEIVIRPGDIKGGQRSMWNVKSKPKGRRRVSLGADALHH